MFASLDIGLDLLGPCYIPYWHLADGSNYVHRVGWTVEPSFNIKVSIMSNRWVFRYTLILLLVRHSHEIKWSRNLQLKLPCLHPSQFQILPLYLPVASAAGIQLKQNISFTRKSLRSSMVQPKEFVKFYEPWNTQFVKWFEACKSIELKGANYQKLLSVHPSPITDLIYESKLYCMWKHINPSSCTN